MATCTGSHCVHDQAGIPDLMESLPAAQTDVTSRGRDESNKNPSEGTVAPKYLHPNPLNPAVIIVQKNLKYRNLISHFCYHKLLTIPMRPDWTMPLWPWPAGVEVLGPSSSGGGPEAPEADSCCCCCCCWRRAWICCGDTEMG